jgi:hypothetical protein
LLSCIANWYLYGHLVSLWPFGIFLPFWYVVPKKNLATLLGSSFRERNNFFTKVLPIFERMIDFQQQFD